MTRPEIPLDALTQFADVICSVNGFELQDGVLADGVNMPMIVVIAVTDGGPSMKSNCLPQHVNAILEYTLTHVASSEVQVFHGKN